jgi:hypothetical protein
MKRNGGGVKNSTNIFADCRKMRGIHHRRSGGCLVGRGEEEMEEIGPQWDDRARWDEMIILEGEREQEKRALKLGVAPLSA